MKKNIPFFIVCSILVFIGMRILGVQESIRLSETIPRFNGNDLKYDTGIFSTISSGILCIYAALWLVSAIRYALSHKYKLVKKLIIIPCVLILGTITLLISTLLYMAPSSDSFADNYYPEYYVVYDRDKTVKLLFAEGMYYFDAVTKVYYLDDDNSAYIIGQFSADGILQGGKYDITRQDDTISFSYDYGTRDEHHNPVYHSVTFVLPSN